MLLDQSGTFDVTTSATEKLPDVLATGLKVVFVGTAAGRRSAAVGAYYAHPGNRFWRTLHEVGLTPRCFAPRDFAGLRDLGIGLTDIAKSASGMDHEIAKHAYDPGGFVDKITLYRPRCVAFTSKRAASLWLRQPTRKIHVGRQPGARIGASYIFVLPSPSGAASRHWSIEPWRELARAVRGTAPG